MLFRERERRFGEGGGNESAVSAKGWVRLRRLGVGQSPAQTSGPQALVPAPPGPKPEGLNWGRPARGQRRCTCGMDWVS